MKPYYLIDKSVLARDTKPSIGPRLQPLIEAGLVARTSVTDLEVGYSARSGSDWRRQRALLAALVLVPIHQGILERAVEVQGMLAKAGRQPSASVADLVVAAVAELAGLVVLHYKRDFDLIAGVTGQVVRWVVPPGQAD